MHVSWPYNQDMTRSMTTTLDRETLTAVEDDVRNDLEAAAKEFLEAPAKFRAAILRAAARGENANAITAAIGFAYSPDYVRRLIREARAAGEIPERTLKSRRKST